MQTCAWCGQACEADDLVCARCSETRIRAALPAEGLPPSVEEGSLDQLLERMEKTSGEKAHHVVASIDGTLGGEVTVNIAVVTAPEGPHTPAEEIWSSPAPLTSLSCGSSEVAAARLSWIERVTTVRGLAPPEIARHYRVGTRGYPGDPSAVGMLLDARLHMARRALASREGPIKQGDTDSTPPQACSIEESGETLRVVADFTQKGAIELFSVTPATAELRAAIAEWIASH
jgi:hypothetical protein